MFKPWDKLVCIEEFEVDNLTFYVWEEVYCIDESHIELIENKRDWRTKDAFPSFATWLYWDIEDYVNEFYFNLAKPKQKFYLDI